MFDAAWSYIYVAYNCVLYQWVFSVHRVNLYGGSISVAEFRYRQKLSWRYYFGSIGIIFLINNVVVIYEAFLPTRGRNYVIQSILLVEYLTLFICFAVIGTVLVFLM